MPPQEPNISSRLVKWHDRYARTGDAVAFVTDVQSHYNTATLRRLAEAGDVFQRRAATEALGLTLDDRDCAVLGKRLSDPDRRVRCIAEHWVAAVWMRIVPPHARLSLQALARSVRFAPRDVMMQLHQWERVATQHAVIWQLRGEALQGLGCTEEAIECHRIALQIDAYRFPAACRQAELLESDGRYGAALRLFHEALRIFPDLPRVRQHTKRLAQSMGDAGPAA